MNEIIREIVCAIGAQRNKARSAWKRGVIKYAFEMLESLEMCIDSGAVTKNDLKNENIVETALLNGASDWYQYSASGCALVYDSDIAYRLCTPTEFTRSDCGRRAPNKYQTWLNVQAGACYEASRIIIEAARNIE